MSFPDLYEDVLQANLREWTEKQFPTRNLHSILAHLHKEIAELEQKPDDMYEFADCFMLLFDAASFQNKRMSDIFIAIEQKLEINKKRKWGEPNSEGFTEHIREKDD